jgi:hypothetical protein
VRASAGLRHHRDNGHAGEGPLRLLHQQMSQLLDARLGNPGQYLGVLWEVGHGALLAQADLRPLKLLPRLYLPTQEQTDQLIQDVHGLESSTRYKWTAEVYWNIIPS